MIILVPILVAPNLYRRRLVVFVFSDDDISFRKWHLSTNSCIPKLETKAVRLVEHLSLPLVDRYHSLVAISRVVAICMSTRQAEFGAIEILICDLEPPVSREEQVMEEDRDERERQRIETRNE